MTLASAAKLDDYRTVAPRGAVDFLVRIGERLRGRRLVHVSASRYSGSFVEILNRLGPIMNDLGIEASWEVIVGTADFDAVTAAVRAALEGTERVIGEAMLERLQATCLDNARRLALDGDLVLVHDAAPLLLVEGRPPGGRWLWRCHGDLSAPQAQVWAHLRRFVEKYDGAVFSLAKFAAALAIPRYLIFPSIDPLSERNREMSRSEQATRLGRLGVPRDKPYLLQVGPFTRPQDPLGVVNAYRLMKKHHDVRLVLAGPEPAPGEGVLDEIREAATQDRDILPVVLTPEPGPDLNALERGATLVLQKPLRADAGIDVAAALWKGKPVVGSSVGGIPAQIVSGVTGYVVDTVEGTAFRVRSLLSNPEQIGRMGALGREHVRRDFLITRHLASYLGLLAQLTA